jgi:membrane protease YdiL (CAAX protease family)
MNDFPSLSDHILVLLFGWLLPFISGVKSKNGLKEINFTEEIRKRFYLSNSIFLFLSAGIIMVQWWWHDRPLSAMGFKPDFNAGSLPATALFVTILTLLYFADLIVNIKNGSAEGNMLAEMQEKAPFMPRHIREIPTYTIMCIAAGVCEEIIYRGFMVTYFLPEFNGRSGIPILAVTAPAFLFSLAHYYQGWMAILKIFLLSLLLGIIFIWSGSLWLVMIIHFLIDLIGGLVMMYLLRKYP